MRFVGFKAGLAGVALLSATAISDARVPQTTDLPKHFPQPWDQMLDAEDESLAQQTPAPAAPVETTPAAPAAPGSGAAPQAPAPSAPEAAQEPVTDEDVLPDLSAEPPADDFSVGEIPAVETVELTADTARKAIDVYVLVRDKYKDAALENYENLQDFVEQDSKGKDFEADIKAAGFATANDWNVAVTTLGFAYSNHVDDQTADIKMQIEEVKADTEMAQDMRDRMVQALTAMIPSDNNRTIVAEMMKDPVYAEKLKQLETEEE
ncbi:MAG: hypothetical protein GYA66_01990 [Phyllobacteriaceae bacterium]|nr:hypothetical protein [Phyllobacteriaceae bacterium]